MRTFLAIRLPHEIQEALAVHIRRLRDRLPGESVRWVNPGSIHLTLKFLGELGAPRVDSVIEVSRHVLSGYQPFELRAEGLGVFPQPSRPRVVWVGLTAMGDSLAELQAHLEADLEKSGFEAEGRPYHPHLTLGRTRRDLSRADERALADRLAGEVVGFIGTWRVSDVALMRSQLKHDGPIYTQLEAFPLGASEGP